MSADGLIWTMQLVDGATFHDGTPLTSEDVKFTLELYRDAARGSCTCPRTSTGTR